MDFTLISTQEEFDKAIAERLKRERKTIEEKYADYEELKKQNSEYSEKIKGHDKELKELQDKVSKYESDSVKTRIAHEVGIPYELAARLTGTSEDEIRKDAEALYKIMGTSSHGVPPLKNNEPNISDSKNAAFKKMLENMKGE